MRKRLTLNSYNSESSTTSSSISNDDSDKIFGDLISSLPDSIIVHILSFLTMDQAVATGILSKRWNYLWTCVPNMVYSHPLWKHPSFTRFAEFINHTLALHSGLKINSFVVNFNYVSNCYEYFDLWVRFAIRNKAEELRLVLIMNPGEDGRRRWVKKGSYNYILPPKLYSNSGLRKLELSLCGIAPNSLISWDSLKSLSLKYVRLDEYVLYKILLGSPKLEYLELNNFTGIKRLNIRTASVKKLVLRDYYCDDVGDSDQSELKISCPNVRALEIFGSFGGKTCRLTDHPVSLVDANLDFTLHEICRRYSKFTALLKCQIMVQGLFERLQNAEKLSLGTWVFKVVSKMEKDGLLGLTLACKSLLLNLSESADREDLYRIVNVLEISPNLEALTIIMSSANRPPFCDWKKRHWYPKLKGSLNCLGQHLKIVRVINYVEKAHESEFLKYLLENAQMLEKMIVEVSKSGGGGGDISQLKQELLSIPRASNRAMILFS